MPRVLTQKRSKSSSARHCGRAGCNREIEAGESYYVWSFRNGGKHFRCMEHPPLRSELTNSKMSGVYAAIEDAEQNLGTIDEMKAAIEAVAEVAREVVEEYREAAEQFGGAGENVDRADELESWVDDLGQFEPEEPEETEFDEDAHEEEILERARDEDITPSQALAMVREEWEEEHNNDREDATNTARDEANDLLSNCPL